MLYRDRAFPSYVACKAVFIKAAEESARKIYLEAGGRKVPGLDQWAKLNVSRALKILTLVGVARKKGEKIIRGS